MPHFATYETEPQRSASPDAGQKPPLPRERFSPMAACDFERLLTGEQSGHSFAGFKGDIRGHFCRPRPLCSIRRLRPGVGVHWPPRATNRVPAWAIPAWPTGSASASASSARARYAAILYRRNHNVHLPLEHHHIEHCNAPPGVGRPFAISTTTSGVPPRSPAKRGRRWRAGCCNMRSSAALGRPTERLPDQARSAGTRRAWSS